VIVGVPADLPVPTIDPAKVRNATRQILRQRQFQPPRRNLLQAAWHWLTTELGKLISSLFGGGVGGSFATNGGTVLVVVVVAVVVTGLVLVTVRRRRLAGHRGARDPAVALRREGRSRSPSEWRAEAAAHEAAGRWRDALRCRYRALVAELVGRGLIEEIPGRTSGEYRGDVTAVAPAAGPAFDGATELFEQAWYGDRPTGPEDQDRFDDLARQVLTPVGGGPSPSRGTR
jgi:Domain of unknown function (DUF4129)